MLEVRDDGHSATFAATALPVWRSYHAGVPAGRLQLTHGGGLDVLGDDQSPVVTMPTWPPWAECSRPASLEPNRRDRRPP